MNYGRTPRATIADYERVGRPVSSFDIRVSLDHIEPLKKLVENDFFRALGKVSVEYPDISRIRRAGVRIDMEGPYDYDSPDLFVGASLLESSASWRLMLARAKYSYKKRHDKTTILHVLEVEDDRVVAARKTARLKRGIVGQPIDFVDETLMLDKCAYLDSDEVVSVRRMYERPIEPVDCEDLRNQLQHAINYAEVMK